MEDRGTTRANPLSPDQYDQWYRTKKGQWSGTREYQVIRQALNIPSEASVLDVGCGTGYFTRRFALDQTGTAAGIDPDEDAIGFARRHAACGETYDIGTGESLPYDSGTFDYAISVTALCFVSQQIHVIREMARVAKIGIAVGVLNYHSILRLMKSSGSSAYAGAQWHTKQEVYALVHESGCPRPHITTAIVIPGGCKAAKIIETIVPDGVPIGSFMLAAVTFHEPLRAIGTC